MRPILVPCCGFVLMLAAAWPAPAPARTLRAKIERVTTPVATLRQVEVSLAWPADAHEGDLQLRIGYADAPDLGYRLRDVRWRCALRRVAAGWRCEGPVRTPQGAATLALELDEARTRAVLARGRSRIALDRDAASPDLTRLDLTAVPLAWTQALLRQAWEEVRLGEGRVDARLAIAAPNDAPLRVQGPVAIADAAFDTPDGQIAGQGLGARLQVDAAFGKHPRFAVDGTLASGELLFGNAYLAPQGPVAFALDARAEPGGAGWRFPSFSWNDGQAVTAAGSGRLDGTGALVALDVYARSDDLEALSAGYLSGWLGVAGLSDLRAAGALQARIAMRDGALADAHARLQAIDLSDPDGRFAFDNLHGEVALSAEAPVRSELRWDGGALYGLAFGAARFPLRSEHGVLKLEDRVLLPMMGGQVGIDSLAIRPPKDGQRLDVRFGLSLQELDVETLATTLGWPAFAGELTGSIPQARYAEDRLDFDGGLTMSVFDGRIRATSLAMERPFGTAPTLSADVELDGLDLHDLTRVFDFGSITGRLDGHIDGLRLVDWTPVAFDMALQTRRTRGVPQRISQRAVQSISSVGDASLVTSLQSQLIQLFDDFGYRRIGISCRLLDEVCDMDGLGSAGTGFIIVEGAGLPRLTVVGFNRRVDWPTLLERLGAVGSGDVSPVVE